MNLYKVILFLLFTCTAFSQHQISGKIQLTDDNSRYQYITVLLKQRDSIYTGSQVDDSGYYKLVQKVPNGNYRIVVEQLGYKGKIEEDIVVNDSDLLLNFEYPKKCEFHKEKPGKCVDGHTDKIIPIIYGLPSKATMKKAKRGQLHLGGCEIWECSPYFFCTIHQKQL